VRAYLPVPHPGGAKNNYKKTDGTGTSTVLQIFEVGRFILGHGNVSRSKSVSVLKLPVVPVAEDRL
jgi:hypothetical protein